MPKVRGSAQGVRVYGQIRSMDGKPLANEKIEFALTAVCFWHGSLISQTVTAVTDAQGNWQVYLPPTRELASATGGRIYHTVKHRFLPKPIQFLVPDDVPEISLDKLLGG